MTLDRRAFLHACSCAGIASPLLPGILLTLSAQAQEAAPGVKAATLPKITAEMLDRAAELAGVGPFTAEQKKMMLDGLNDQRDAYAQIRALKLTNDVPPAYVFHPEKAAQIVCDPNCETLPLRKGEETITITDDGGYGHRPVPANIEDMAFWSVLELGKALGYRQGQIG